MSSAGFEPAIPASERPQTHALNHAATQIDVSLEMQHKYIQPVSLPVVLPPFSSEFNQKWKASKNFRKVLQ
jgi:hypothetical protein